MIKDEFRSPKLGLVPDMKIPIRYNIFLLFVVYWIFIILNVNWNKELTPGLFQWNLSKVSNASNRLGNSFSDIQPHSSKYILVWFLLYNVFYQPDCNLWHLTIKHQDVILTRERRPCMSDGFPSPNPFPTFSGMSISEPVSEPEIITLSPWLE